MKFLPAYRRLVDGLGPAVGNRLATLAVCLKAPYFLTIRPLILSLAPGDVSIHMPDSWLVHNHLATTHAIAQCNLIELAMGLMAEASVPDHLRWIPMGMDVSYQRPAKGALVARATLSALGEAQTGPSAADGRTDGHAGEDAAAASDPAQHFMLDSYPGTVVVPVSVRDAHGEQVSAATVRLWITERAPTPSLGEGPSFRPSAGSS
jgi:acyl-coenzyme A thioesterase PaaI-like protein